MNYAVAEGFHDCQPEHGVDGSKLLNRNWKL